MKKRNSFRCLVGTAILVAGTVALWGQGESTSLKLADDLERAIFLHQGEANLDEAAHVLERILEEASLVDSLAAEAKYRLALVYFDQGKKALGMKMLNEVVELYPNEAHWVAEAKELLPQDFVPETTPWEDGERTHYIWVLPSGDEIGYSFSTIYSYEWEGKSLWRKESRFMLNGHRATVVEFDKESFNSTYSMMSLGDSGEVRAWYAPDGLSAKVEYAKTGAVRNFDFPIRAYDNEQAVELLRQIPLEVGYSMSKKIFVTFSGFPIDINFEIMGIEKMDTALGSVDCYEVQIDMGVQKQTVYFTADERRILVKMVAGGVEGVLSKLETVDVSSDATYQNTVHNYELTIPAEWAAVPQLKGNSDDEQLVWLADPLVRGKFLSQSELRSAWDAEEKLTLDNLLGKARRNIGRHFQGLEQDESWGRPLEIDGMKGRAMRLRHPDGSGNGDTVYIYAVMGETKYHILQAVIPEGQDEMLAVFEEIVMSLRATL